MNNRNYIQEAGAECASLLTEGYITRVYFYDKRNKQAYTTLVHTRNRNIIRINATRDGYVITKNGTIIKRVTAESEVHKP